MNKFFFRIIIISLIFYSILLCSCKHLKKGSHHWDYTLTLNDTIHIDLKNDENYFSYFTYVIDSGEDSYLLRENFYQNELILYERSSVFPVKRYRFQREGPQGLNLQGAAVYMFKPDSFCIVSIPGRTFITYKDSIVFRRKNIQGDEIFRSYGDNPCRPHKIGEKIYFWRASDIDYRNKAYYKQPLYFSFNLKTHRFENENIFFPPEIKDKIWHVFQARSFFTQKDSSLYIGFVVSDKIYKYDVNKKKVSDSFVPLSPAGKSFYPIKLDEHVDSRLKRTFMHVALEYDKYKNVFYRITRLPVSDKINVTNKRDGIYTQPLLIQVMDSNFNILVERKLSENTFDSHDYFIDKKGLWISLNNPENPIFKEDEIKFLLLKLEKK